MAYVKKYSKINRVKVNTKTYYYPCKTRKNNNINKIKINIDRQCPCAKIKLRNRARPITLRDVRIPGWCECKVILAQCLFHLEV